MSSLYEASRLDASVRAMTRIRTRGRKVVEVETQPDQREHMYISLSREPFGDAKNKELAKCACFRPSEAGHDRVDC
jgi:hypothetical protein